MAGFVLHGQLNLPVQQVLLALLGEHEVDDFNQGVLLILIQLVKHHKLLVKLMVLKLYHAAFAII